MSGNKILFAVIGDPSGYKPVEYVYVDEESGQSFSEEDNVSFGALARMLSINNIVVITGFSLLSKDYCKGYRDCANKVVDYVKDKLKLSDDFRLLVAPNVYGDSFIQERPGLDLYFNFVYYNALKTMEELNVGEVYLDVSHGINYMPLLAKDAVMLALSAYVHSVGRGVKFVMFNSDPYTQGAQRLRLNVVLRGNVNVRTGINQLLAFFTNESDKSMFQLNSLIDTRVESKLVSKCGKLEVGGCDKQCVEGFETVTFKLAKALSSGLFLLIKSMENVVRDCFSELDNYMKEKFHWGPNEGPNIDISLDQSGENIKAVYRTKAKMGLSVVHALYYALNEILDEMNKYSCDPEKALRLSGIKSLIERFSANDSVESIVSNEIHNLEERRNAIGSGWVLLDEVLTTQQHAQGERRCSPNKRNLLAHGGLERCSTYLRRVDDDICVSYRDCVCEVYKSLG